MVFSSCLTRVPDVKILQLVSLSLVALCSRVAVLPCLDFISSWIITITMEVIIIIIIIAIRYGAKIIVMDAAVPVLLCRGILLTVTGTVT